MTLDEVIAFAKLTRDFVTSPAVGSLASVLGSVISVRVWFSIKDMRRKVLFRQRVPEAISSIREHASAIDKGLQDNDANAEAISTEVALSLETLKAVVDKLDGPAKNSVKTAIAIIKTFKNAHESQRNRAMIRDVYTHLLTAALAIENSVADSKQEL